METKIVSKCCFIKHHKLGNQSGVYIIYNVNQYSVHWLQTIIVVYHISKETAVPHTRLLSRDKQNRAYSWCHVYDYNFQIVKFPFLSSNIIATICQSLLFLLGISEWGTNVTVRGKLLNQGYE